MIVQDTRKITPKKVTRIPAFKDEEKEQKFLARFRKFKQIVANKRKAMFQSVLKPIVEQVKKNE